MQYGSVLKSPAIIILLFLDNQDCENTDSSYKGEFSKSGQKYDFWDINNQEILSFVLVHLM